MDDVSGRSGAIPSAAKKVGQRFTVNDPRHDFAFSPGAGMLRMTQHSTSSGCWWSGDFVDYRGIVTIQMEDTYTRLDAVAGNRCHVRTWERAFPDNTMAKLCRAFLTDLHGAPASAIETGTAKTEGLGPKDESATRQGDAQ